MTLYTIYPSTGIYPVSSQANSGGNRQVLTHQCLSASPRWKSAEDTFFSDFFFKSFGIPLVSPEILGKKCNNFKCLVLKFIFRKAVSFLQLLTTWNEKYLGSPSTIPRWMHITSLTNKCSTLWEVGKGRNGKCGVLSKLSCSHFSLDGRLQLICVLLAHRFSLTRIIAHSHQSPLPFRDTVV